MAADDLSAPLVRKGILGRIARFRTTPLRFAAFLLVAVAAAIFVFLRIYPDPNGGEPVAVVKLTPEDAAGQQDGVSSDELGMRSALKPEDNVDLANRPVATAKTETSEDNPVRRALGAVPQKGLFEKGRYGLLPRIGPDGRRPSQAYARPANRTAGGTTGGTKVAILVGGLGLSTKGTNDAIRRLPPEVSLAFAPYPKNLQRWVERARQNGHEVMLQLPMEPFDYPNNDPGPYTLRTDVSARENAKRLDWLLSRFTGYFGVTNYMGAKFTSVPDALRPTLKQISARGLIYVDDGSSARSQTKRVSEDVGLATTTADVIIDAEPTPSAISAALQKLERIAKERGIAVGVASGLPITIDQIVEWNEELRDRDIVMVPVSAVLTGEQS